MKSGRWIVRAAAVVSAVTLLVVYVYDQAGGKILPSWGHPDRHEQSSEWVDIVGDMPPSQSSDKTLMYSSKSGRVVSPTLLPGSKSSIAIPAAASSRNSNSAQQTSNGDGDDGVQQHQRRPVLLPGSKAPAAPVFNVDNSSNSSQPKQPQAQR